MNIDLVVSFHNLRLRSSMADSSERNNTPHFEEDTQMENTNNQAQTEPEDDEDYVDDDFDEEEEEEDSYSEEEEEDEDDEEEDDDEDEEGDMDPAVTSPRVSVNSVEAVGEANGCGGGGKVEAAAEGGEVDGLICSICMGPWTSGGDHQVCCLSCGHLYGLSCIRRWLERRKGSAKCPQCNQKCKPKDVRVIYASRIIVADEESKEKIKLLEAKCASIEKMMAKTSFILSFDERMETLSQQLEELLTSQKEWREEQRTWQRELLTSMEERARIHDQWIEEQRTWQHKFTLFMQQHQGGGSSTQSWTPPLPSGPAQ